MSFELPTKVIQVGGETLTVSQASNLADAKRSLMISEADGRWAGELMEGMDAQAKRYLETLLYPSLIACTTGNLPTLDEFLNGVSIEDTEAWLAAARELNPRWFPTLEAQTPEEKEAELEKNE